MLSGEICNEANTSGPDCHVGRGPVCQVRMQCLRARYPNHCVSLQKASEGIGGRSTPRGAVTASDVASSMITATLQGQIEGERHTRRERRGEK